MTHPHARARAEVVIARDDGMAVWLIREADGRSRWYGLAEWSDVANALEPVTYADVTEGPQPRVDYVGAWVFAVFRALSTRFGPLTLEDRRKPLPPADPSAIY
jgi:hypothetical protein